MRCERQAEYGYDTVLVQFPAAYLRRRRDQRAALAEGDHEHQEEAARREGGRRRWDRARPRRLRERPRALRGLQGAAGEGRRPEIIEDEDTNTTVATIIAWLDEEDFCHEAAASWSTRCTTTVRSTRTTRSAREGAHLAAELGTECHAVFVVGEGIADDLRLQLGNYGASKVYRVEGPEGLAQPVVDAMAAAIEAGGHGYALFGGGLLRRASRSARPRRAPRCQRAAGGHRGARRGRQADRQHPILKDSQISSVHYRPGVGVIIGRLNAFELKRMAAPRPVDLNVEFQPRLAAGREWCSAASSAARTSTSRTRTSSWPAVAGSARPRASRRSRRSPARSAAQSRDARP